jgi:hypothetical protein
MVKSSKGSKGSKGSEMVAVLPLAYVVTGAARPSAGSALASYTAAWLQLSGMATGHVCPAATVRQVAGDTALAYHVKQGNMERTDKGIQLTEQGILHFLSRTKIQPDPEMVKAYEEVLSKGKPNGMVKNPEFIKAIKG